MPHDATTQPAGSFGMSGTATTGSTSALYPPRWLRLVAWAAAAWIAWELLFYEQYKLAGPTLVFDVLSAWSGIPEKPFRLFVAAMEITASILVLIPRTQVLGALFALGIMSGAIFFHLFTPLGVDPYGDGGMLFKEACFTWAMAALVVAIRRRELLRFVGMASPALAARLAFLAR